MPTIRHHKQRVNPEARTEIKKEDRGEVNPKVKSEARPEVRTGVKPEVDREVRQEVIPGVPRGERPGFSKSIEADRYIAQGTPPPSGSGQPGKSGFSFHSSFRRGISRGSEVKSSSYMFCMSFSIRSFTGRGLPSSSRKEPTTSSLASTRALCRWIIR